MILLCSEGCLVLVVIFFVWTLFFQTCISITYVGHYVVYSIMDITSDSSMLGEVLMFLHFH